MSGLDNISWIKSNGVKPEKGCLLISEPFLSDMIFQRSVVLLIDNEGDGAFGVVLNKQVKTSFNEIVKGFPAFNAPIYIGGPVAQESLFFIHNMGDEIPGSIEIMPGVFWGGDVEEIKQLIMMGMAKPENFKFFLGYSGWDPNQLEEEMNNNSWVINSTNANQIFNADPNNMWEDNIKHLGGDYLHWLNFPLDPALN